MIQHSTTTAGGVEALLAACQLRSNGEPKSHEVNRLSNQRPLVVEEFVNVEGFPTQ